MPVYSIEAENLTKIFEKKAETEGKGLKHFLRRVRPKKEEIRAVDHINLKIEEGELFGLLGPNGAGKTTTIKLLCTLLIPDEGTATVNGYDVTKHPREVQRSIGVVTGGERGLYWRLTGRENLWFFSQLYNIPGNIAKKRIDELLPLVELEKRADDHVEKYSRGMKQRLHVIRGLINDPPILLMDEPTLGLDPGSARVIRDFVKDKLQGEQNKTILHTTHYMEEADQLCDRIAIIDHGKIIALDTPGKLKKKIRRTDIISLTVSNLRQADEKRLQTIDGVKKAVTVFTDPTVGGATIKIHCDNAEEVMPVATEFLIRNGARIMTLEQAKPTLEDVFVSMTGRKLRD
ncbi:MAG: ATP-binding cassette domain-containing protein [Candidatus Bathyarchaeota archaeon]|nr:MAG: ATP-binding cassette domain-containing protein [Candidatus Bathyarchaeota archaeon]